MQLIKRIFDFYIYSNIHVGLAGLCITKITLIKFGIIESFTPYFVGLSIIISYNFIRFYEIKNKHLIWFKNWFFDNQGKLILLTFLACSIIGYIIFFTDFDRNSLVILFPFALMTFFYAIPLFKIGNIEVSFRNFPSIKIFSIGIAWAGISVFFPLYEAHYTIDRDVYLEFVQRFLFLIALTLPFDIRDVQIDSKSLKTIPQVLGISASKKIGLILLTEFVLLELCKLNFSFENMFILMAIAIIVGLFLWFSSPDKTRYYTSFWVESVPIIWIGFYVLF
jgi:hypothetical protein